MDKFGLIGHPIGHSLSPRLFEAAYHGKYGYDLIEGPDFSSSWDRFLSDYKAINITAPFKNLAFEKAEYHSEDCLRCGASNLCIKTPDGIKAYNSDYLGVKAIIGKLEKGTAAIVGFGGAGKAAMAAAQDCGFETTLYRHNEISRGISADIVIYTLPSEVEGSDKIQARNILEANYRKPCLSGHEGYISGKEWLIWQAITGYSLMTGEMPDAEAIKEIFL